MRKRPHPDLQAAFFRDGNLLEKVYAESVCDKVTFSLFSLE
jgi:hypothetical protein